MGRYKLVTMKRGQMMANVIGEYDNLDEAVKDAEAVWGDGGYEWVEVDDSLREERVLHYS